MSTSQKITLSYFIPVVYRCSKCGSGNVALIPVNTEKTVTYGDLASRRRRTEKIADGYQEAYSALRDNIKRHYGKRPLDWRKEIVGQCGKCKHTELWMMDPDTYERQGKLGCLYAFLIIAGFFAGGILLDNLFDLNAIGFVISFAAVSLLAVFGEIMFNKIFPKKERARLDAVAAIPEEDAPYYLYGLDRLLSEVARKERSTIQKLWDELEGNTWQKKQERQQAEKNATPEEVGASIAPEILDYCAKNSLNRQELERFLDTLIKNEMLTDVQKQFLLDAYTEDSNV